MTEKASNIKPFHCKLFVSKRIKNSLAFIHVSISFVFINVVKYFICITI